MRRILLLGLMLQFLTGCASTRSEASLRESVFALTPLGSTYEEVLKVAAREGWTNVRQNRQAGFFVSGISSKEWKAVGVSSITAWLGRYPHLPVGSKIVAVAWGFDTSGRLIDIHVTKSIDTL